ncbi:MAG: two-component sensor histidine kinase [Gammaproteobacteria bacterium]|nr:MAG: two-component sensor histidine kinase [Gammaproteobacteria bacterium]
MKLGRTFFSLYILITATFILFSWLLDEVWSSYLEQDIESYTGYKTMLATMGDYLQQHPQEEWPKLVAKTAKKYQVPLTLNSTDILAKEDPIHIKSLQQGNTHVYYNNDEVVIHYKLENSKSILNLGPAKMPSRPRYEAIIRITIFAMLAIVIFIWIWPMSRDLDLLKKATIAFGKGEFSSKAPNAKTATIAPMVNAFNSMAERIKRLIDAHKELSSAVSHELRTPLARTKFALQMLTTVKDEQKQKKYLKQINDDVNELDGLINEMLIYAAFDSDKPKLNIESVVFADLIKVIVEQHQQYTGTVIINNDIGDLAVKCDSYFISRAINNCISNAIKYGDNIISITLKLQKSHFSIIIEDNGQGVADEFKATVFDAFSRGDQSRNRETGGFGLGLAIVSRIMEWHQGNVSVKNSELGGAKFILTWPVKHHKTNLVTK